MPERRKRGGKFDAFTMNFENGYKILHGTEFNENDNVRRGTVIMHGYNILHGGDLNKISNLIHVNYSCMLNLFFWGDINGNDIMKLRETTYFLIY